jgi:hypothetical protein
MNTTIENAKKVRTILRTLFKNRPVKISVTKGTGTACNWVHANIDLVKPNNCTCTEYSTYCQSCKDAMHLTREVVEKSIKAAKINFDTFTSDDGYNTELENFLLQISAVKQF